MNRTAINNLLLRLISGKITFQATMMLPGATERRKYHETQCTEYVKGYC